MAVLVLAVLAAASLAGSRALYRKLQMGAGDAQARLLCAQVVVLLVLAAVICALAIVSRFLGFS